MPRWSNQFRTAFLDPASSGYRQGYHKGHTAGLPGIDADLIAANIKWRITVFGILGTMTQWIYDLSFPELAKLIIPTPTLALAAAEDHSGGGFTVTAPSLSAPAPSVTKVTELSSPNALGGGVWHDDAPPTDTDYTAQVNSPSVNDFPLIPNPGAVGDGFYFGYASAWDWLAINIGTAGAGTWTITWKYWNGTTWTALTLKYDETANWRTTGLKRVHFVRPGDWATIVIAGLNMYWIKAEITSYTSETTQPLGTQAWCGQW